MILEPSARRQVYVEDCEVCCHPIQISFTGEGDSLTSFEAKALE